MKILHLCLASFYIDNFSYQENMLPKFHKNLGYEVEILSSLVSFDENGNQIILKNPREYINEYGIPVTRMKYKKGVHNKILRHYDKTYYYIEKSNPDIIFIHGCQFIDMISVRKYLKENNNVKVYIDNHADFSNSARNFLSKNLLHGIVWKHCAKIIEPYAEKFFGVLPARVKFLQNIYGISKSKTELLVMGADDDEVIKAETNNSREIIRTQYGIKKDEFLIVTGGKIDQAKLQIFHLIEAVKELKEQKVKLIIFGSIIEELKEDIVKEVDGISIHYAGWVNVSQSYEYILAADLMVFPGRHSVYWEQSVGTGSPLLVKFWEGTTHVNVNGNCKFLYENNASEIKKEIFSLVNTPELYKKMKQRAAGQAQKDFLYSNIAIKSLEN